MSSVPPEHLLADLIAALPKRGSLGAARGSVIELETHDRTEEFIDLFKPWAAAVEKGMAADAPEDMREERLRRADHELCAYVDEYPAKGELLSLIVALEDGLRARTNSAMLTAPVCHRERAFLFTGWMTEILRDYGLHHHGLYKKELDRLTSAFNQSAAALKRLDKLMEQIGRHVLVDQMIGHGHRERISDVREDVVAMAALYRDLLTRDDDAGIKALLVDNGHEIRRQFAESCALLCLKVYGHVTTQILQQCFNLKRMHHLQALRPPEQGPTDAEAERKRLDRGMSTSLTRALRLAQREHWPTLPMLQALARSR
ncbi:hypothetical protein [Roseateles toxinivorans]|uniref:Uncharacterized protein n=1 Tax=Roseateles toxinivorans TaxID=270368 RepID=A0A4R6QTM5_9BURK|nr:hypothetical protein [Roseateles toxinivorans]TDP74062.1 hypothetical protein DES47_101109 [Roseateles toxinivorans]